jgi:hypothetical protein
MNISLFVDVINEACNFFNDVPEDVNIKRLFNEKDLEYYEDNNCTADEIFNKITIFK